MRSGAPALAVVLLGILGACGKRDADPAADAAAKVEIGSPAPSYAATTMTGDSVSLGGLRGKVVLLNVWATWCGPCRKEIPELRAIHASYKDRGLELVGVTVDAAGSDDAIRQFTKDFEMAYPIWRDPDERINARYSIVGLPATFLIDRGGILRWKATGPVEPNDTSLASAIGRALGGSSP
jgi:cytochrome c biogenesis protein CcmG/thiol:disulfide interchange protein DsbE